jgi:hypothetical protein
MPPVVYLLCGLTGSGKTTYAKRLEAGGGVRLSVDEEVYGRRGRYGIDYPMDEYFDHERPVVEELRDRLIETRGGTWRLLYFKVDRAVLANRLVERNRREDANALAVTPSALDDFIARFDEPHDEGDRRVRPVPR